jgi:hypothetical protein
MASFKHILSDLTLSNEQVETIFVYDAEGCVKLNKETYKKIIMDELLKQHKTSAYIKNSDDRSRKSIVIDLYCVLKQCERKFKIKCKKDHIKYDEDVKLTMTSTHESCSHDEKFIRQLRGEQRKEIALQAKSTSVYQVRSSAIENSDKKLLESGNLQNIYPKSVIQKAVSEQNCESDKSKDPLYDLFLRANSFKFVYSVEYKYERFSVTILSNKQIQIFEQYLKFCATNKVVSRINFDATGGICASPSEKIAKLFHHTIVIPMKTNEIDRTSSLINIGELISSLHTTHQQEIFLRRFIQMKSMESKKSGTLRH